MTLSISPRGCEEVWKLWIHIVFRCIDGPSGNVEQGKNRKHDTRDLGALILTQVLSCFIYRSTVGYTRDSVEKWQLALEPNLVFPCLWHHKSSLETKRMNMGCLLKLLPGWVCSVFCARNHVGRWFARKTSSPTAGSNVHDRSNRQVKTLHKSEFYADAKSELSNFQSFGIIWVCHGLSKNDVYHWIYHILFQSCV